MSDVYWTTNRVYGFDLEFKNELEFKLFNKRIKVVNLRKTIYQMILNVIFILA